MNLTEHLLQTNITKQLNEKEMLDISILNADKLILNSKKEIDDKKLNKFLNDNYIVEEKFDGTKLTLWRNEKPWNNDYTKNWVIAFKNQILYSEEFENVDLENVKKHSVGISQYGLVHKHIKSIHNKTKSIPTETEFFIEFIQDKLTTTRDYKNKHGLYLIASSPASAEIEGGMIKTKSHGFFQDKNLDYSKILKLNLPPVVFEGKINTVSNIEKGIKNNKLKKSWNDNKSSFDDKPYETIKKTFLEFESELGGKTEGVVLKSSSGILYKFLQDDQHDKNVRYAKKMRYQSQPEVESKYWDKIQQITNNLISETPLKLGHLSYEDILKDLSKEISKMTDGELRKLFAFKFQSMQEEGKM